MRRGSFQNHRTNHLFAGDHVGQWLVFSNPCFERFRDSETGKTARRKPFVDPLQVEPGIILRRQYERELVCQPAE